MANQMFRLAMAVRDGNSYKAIQHYDEGLTTMMKVLEAKEAEQKASAVLASEIGNTITNAYLARDVLESIPSPLSKSTNPPTLVIHHDPSPQVIVTKEESRDKTIQVIPNNVTEFTGLYPFRFNVDPSPLRINVSCGEDDTIDAEEEIEPDIEEEDSEEKCGCPCAPACECHILMVRPDDDGYHRCCALDPACECHILMVRPDDDGYHRC
jgi:hypothetical protein